MATYKLTGPLPEVEIPLLGVVVARGEEFEVPDDLVEFFGDATELWERTDAPADVPEDEPVDEPVEEPEVV